MSPPRRDNFKPNYPTSFPTSNVRGGEDSDDDSLPLCPDSNESAAESLATQPRPDVDNARPSTATVPEPLHITQMRLGNMLDGYYAQNPDSTRPTTMTEYREPSHPSEEMKAKKHIGTSRLAARDSDLEEEERPTKRMARPIPAAKVGNVRQTHKSHIRRETLAPSRVPERQQARRNAPKTTSYRTSRRDTEREDIFGEAALREEARERIGRRKSIGKRSIGAEPTFEELDHPRSQRETASSRVPERQQAHRNAPKTTSYRTSHRETEREDLIREAAQPLERGFEAMRWHSAPRTQRKTPAPSRLSEGHRSRPNAPRATSYRTSRHETEREENLIGEAAQREELIHGAAQPVKRKIKAMCRHPARIWEDVEWDTSKDLDVSPIQMSAMHTALGLQNRSPSIPQADAESGAHEEDRGKVVRKSKAANFAGVPSSNMNTHIEGGINVEKRRKKRGQSRIFVCQYPGCNKGYQWLKNLNRHTKLKCHGQRLTTAKYKTLVTSRANEVVRTVNAVVRDAAAYMAYMSATRGPGWDDGGNVARVVDPSSERTAKPRPQSWYTDLTGEDAEEENVEDEDEAMMADEDKTLSENGDNSGTIMYQGTVWETRIGGNSSRREEDSSGRQEGHVRDAIVYDSGEGMGNDDNATLPDDTTLPDNLMADTENDENANLPYGMDVATFDAMIDANLAEMSSSDNETC